MQTNTRRFGSRKGTALFVGMTSLVVIVPFIGLAVDVGYLYAVKATLQTGVDGAALAAARALSLGLSTGAQETSAKNNAVNWFYANFPNGYFGTKSTVMSAADVQVFDDPVNPLVRNVTVTAKTDVPTYFMKWFNFEWTTVSAIGNAARRDVNIMLVLDRSSSMNSNNGCANMRTAAKLFTGQFANGRDRIGMVTYADTIFIESQPVQNFQSVLGYSNGTGNAAGKIDAIVCNGNTGIPGAFIVGYNEVYKMNLPGALNVIMFMTDGLPNNLIINTLQSGAAATSTSVAGTLMRTVGTKSPCQDSLGRALSGTGNWITNPRAWQAGVNFGSNSLLPNLPAGPIGGVGSGDSITSARWGVRRFWATSTASTYNRGTYTTSQAPGCSFSVSGESTFQNDIAWLPEQDAFGNNLTGYRTPIRRNSDGRIRVDDTETILNASFNASDDAASRARTNGTIPAYVFVVGLGGTSGAPPNYQLLQRMANDPNPDLFNTPALYSAVANQPNQFVGTFIFSSDPSELSQAFLKISAMILRLSR
jgi:Flp pilus assembly protein TadG